MNSTKLFGLGEHKTPFLKSFDWKILTFFNKDQPPVENEPLYGSHTFYLNVEDSSTGQSNGIYHLNSNAVYVLLRPESAITWRPIGDILDLFVFLGDSPADVVSQYISLIGKPSMPPFWSLGYLEFRCCPTPPYRLKEQQVIWKRTRDAGIPFDVQWDAKEYMNRERICRHFCSGGSAMLVRCRSTAAVTGSQAVISSIQYFLISFFLNFATPVPNL